MFGGTMQEFAALVSPLVPVRRGPGQGVWEHLTDGHSLTLLNSSSLTLTALLRGGV